MRAYIREDCWNVDNRSQFLESRAIPDPARPGFLRRGTADEIAKLQANDNLVSADRQGLRRDSERRPYRRRNYWMDLPSGPQPWLRGGLCIFTGTTWDRTFGDRRVLNLTGGPVALSSCINRHLATCRLARLTA